MKVTCLHCQNSIILPGAINSISMCVCRVSGSEHTIFHSCDDAVLNETGEITRLNGEYILSDRERLTEKTLHDKSSLQGLAVYVRKMHFMQSAEYGPDAINAQYYKSARKYWQVLDEVDAERRCTK